MVRQSTAQPTRMEVVEERLAQLQAIIERQEARIEEQQAKIEELSNPVRPDLARSGRRRMRQAGPNTSRRALLKWGGVAAASATVALVAGEQTAHASSVNDGDFLKIGNANFGNAQTSLAVTGTTSVTPFFQVNASGQVIGSGSFPPVPTAIAGLSNATYGNGVWGFTSGSGGVGVLGTSGNVLGIGPGGSGIGVYGLCDTEGGTGVIGSGGDSTANGVEGDTWGGTGVTGSSSNGLGGMFTGGQAPIALGTGGAAGPPSSGTHTQGEIYLDVNAAMWVCTMGGTSGAWTKVTAIPSGTLGGALVFFSAPFRVYDTRPGVGAQGGGGPMSTGQIITVNITGVVDPANSSIVVPAGATGIIGDLIAIAPSGAGFLGIQPHTGSHNSQAWVNYTSGVTIHNSVVVGLSSDGKVDIECSLASSGMGLTITGYII